MYIIYVCIYIYIYILIRGYSIYNWGCKPSTRWDPAFGGDHNVSCAHEVRKDRQGKVRHYVLLRALS